MSFAPPTYSFSVVSVQRSSGKSCLCKRLIDSNWDNYQSFISLESNARDEKVYWGSIKHRRFDEKREAIFHFVEHGSIAEHETFDAYLKRVSTLTFRLDEKTSSQSSRALPKEKLGIDGFLCIYDLSAERSHADFLSLLHVSLKTRRPVLIVTTKNDRLAHQSTFALQFEQAIHASLPTIPIVHTSAHEHVNIQSVLELALYACDETSRKSLPTNKYQPPTFAEAGKNEQSLKHVIQTEYRTLLNRHVPDFRLGSWEKFYDRWQHHTSVQTFIDMFGKAQANCLYHEHNDELRRTFRQKLIDERLIPIVELLVTDPKSKISRNWDFVRAQMQRHPRYASTVIPASLWSDWERQQQTNSSSTALAIPDDLLETDEARLRFESYMMHRQSEQTRRLHCRAFFDLLSRFSEAGLVHYGDSYDKDCVYFLGRECYEALNSQDRLRIFALHQSYLYRLLCLQFVELLFESLEIFISTFERMNLATRFTDEKTFQHRKMTTLTIDDIFQRDIIEQIKDDPRYRLLNKRETDRHRLIMCHCHFLYDCIYYSSGHLNRSFKQRKRSFKRRKSSSISSTHQLSVDDNFCPYTRKIGTNNQDDNNETNMQRKFDIACPMESTCVDIRIVQQIFARLKSSSRRKNLLICGEVKDVEQCFQWITNDPTLIGDYPIHLFTLDSVKSQTIDGCLLVSPNAQEVFQAFVSRRKSFTNGHGSTSPIPRVQISDLSEEELKSSVERLLFTNHSPMDLRILVCLMCGGEKNEVEHFIEQLSTRFTLVETTRSSFMITASLGRSTRRIEFVCVSFHSLFASKLLDFDGFLLFYDRDRNAAVHTMTYVEKYISKHWDKEHAETDRRPAPIYVLSCVKDVSFSSMRKFVNTDSQSNDAVQYQQGSIRNFIEAHLLLFLNQCWFGKSQLNTDRDHCRSEELLAGVQSYFDRVNDRTPSNLMTHSLDRPRLPLTDQDRVGPLINSSRSNEHSPRHRHGSALTPTNPDQIFSYRSYPHLSHSTNGADSTIVATTPVDPSTTNLSLISSSSDGQQQNVQKSTSMRFAKLIEHPTNGTSYQSSTGRTTNGPSSFGKISASDEMKFNFHKHRSIAQVKVPLATPEIIELNELVTASCSGNTSLSDDYRSSSSANTHPQHSTLINESKQTQESSVESSSDERLSTRRDSTTNNPVGLQRKVSDRKIKRVRAKPLENIGTASSNEILKKPGSDDDILLDDDKQNQKKKRRPSFKRRKKYFNDQTQTDSGIDSRMDSKDSNKINITPEPSSSNVIVSNEEDSSAGDGAKDSKNASIEELEERPTANWIRRQLQYFAQARREKSESKTRTSTGATLSSSPYPSLKTVISTLSSYSNAIPLGSLENSSHHHHHHHQLPVRLILSRVLLSTDSGVPLFVEKCIRFIEENGLTVEGLYRISGYKNQVELVIQKLIEGPSCDLNTLEIPASAVATALKDMMRKLDEPILSLEQFDECQTLTIEQLREQEFRLLQKALARTNELKYRTNRAIFKHLHFVAQHAASTHMDSSNLAVLWWPNLFQPQFHDLRTAEQICQKAKPLVQAMIDNYPIIFSSSEHMKPID